MIEVEGEWKQFWIKYALAVLCVVAGSLIILEVNNGGLDPKLWFLASLFGAIGILILALFIALITGMERK